MLDKLNNFGPNLIHLLIYDFTLPVNKLISLKVICYTLKRKIGHLCAFAVLKFIWKNFDNF